MDSLQLPFFRELSPARNILIAGAGGGFDVFSGLPLYFALRQQGKMVHLANLTFSNLPPGTAGLHLTPELVKVTADSEGSKYYFPEKHLSQWFRDRGEEVPVYAFHRVGPAPIHQGYQRLVELLALDTIILVDGGTDSLMRGDEAGLGTPVEDMSSISAVDQLNVPHRFLVCLGFGVDTFHGVCHSHVLESIAQIDRDGGYLGAFSLTREMPATKLFIEATEHVLTHTSSRPSIVCSSILSAIEGQFGNHHRTLRTEGSALFINPLMALYWCFQLQAVARRILYLPGIREMSGFMEVQNYIEQYRSVHCPNIRVWKDLPM